MFVALLTLLNLPVKAQTFQFLPEVDAYSRVNSDTVRVLATVNFLACVDRGELMGVGISQAEFHP
jgi:hypothetical protein